MQVVAHAHQAEAQPGAAQGQGHGHGHGHGHGGAPATGFIAEMRTVAMKLHTKEQAPKEGEAPRKPESKPMPQVSARGCALSPVAVSAPARAPAVCPSWLWSGR